MQHNKHPVPKQKKSFFCRTAFALKETIALYHRACERRGKTLSHYKRPEKFQMKQTNNGKFERVGQVL